MRSAFGFRLSALGLAAVLSVPGVSIAQTLDERLDEERFLQGLTELQLDDLLRHYVERHPPDDPGRAARYEIAAERMTLHDPAVRPEERLAGIERILARRAALLDAERGDPRRSGWLADQASDLFFELLAYEASGLAALAGLPTPAQRARAERVAREMNGLTMEAELAIEQTLMDLEQQEGFARDVAAQLRRQRLDRDERRRRIPFLRGVAAVLMAELGLVAGADREEYYALAAEMLEPLDDALAGALASRARVYLAIALMRLGELERSAALLETVIDDEATVEPDRFLARIFSIEAEHAADAAARLAALRSLAQRHGDGPDDVVYRLLVVDRMHLLLRDRGDVREAFEVYVGLLDEAPVIPESTWRRLVFERLTTAAGGDLPTEGLPVIVQIARAERLAGADETRAEAIEMLTRVVDRDDVMGRDRAAALFALGRALEESRRPLDAALRFTELAREHPEHPEAERAVERGAVLAAAAYRREAGDESREILRESLDLLLSRYPGLATVDQWRALAGRVALSERRYDDAIAAFSAVGPDSQHWLESQMLQVSAARSAAAAAEGDAQRARREAALQTLDRVRPRIESVADRGGNDARALEARLHLARLRVFEAGLLLDLNRAQQALATLEGLETEPGLEGPLVAEVLRLRINALRALDRAADAQREAARFIEAAPDDAGRVLGSMLAAVQREVHQLLEVSRDEDAITRARAELVPLAEMLGQWLDGRDVDVDQRLLLERQIADAHRLAEDWSRALPMYDRLLAGYPDAVQLLLGRAECLFGLGGERLAEAMMIYRRLGAAGPGSDAASERRYWQAQLRMLQILDRTERNTAKIVPRIQRLRQQNPQLGGERVRRQMEALQNKYS